MMNLHSVKIHVVSSPLNAPFTTRLQHVTRREALIIEARDQDGRIGYGEADPFSSPWYSEETVHTCQYMMKSFLIPLLLQQNIQHPDQLDQIWSGVRGNYMAKSGLSQALWDLYAKQKGVYLGHLFGKTRTHVDSGIVIAAADVALAVAQIEKLESETNYKRYKIKIMRDNAFELLHGIRQHFPDLPIMADANSAYSLHDLGMLQELDQFHLLMLEQPLEWNDLVDHAALQQQLRTPICLDESICSYQAAASAVTLGSCKIIALKMARVGGWSAAMRIRRLCLKHGIPLWCGGMIEFGIAKAHNIALASLDGFSMPGDFSPSVHYWRHDLILPEITIERGQIRVPEDQPGIGFTVDRRALSELTVHSECYRP